MPELHGVAVLVTRPEQQATRLCELLDARGALPIRLPAVRIEPVELSAASRAALESSVRRADLIIFTSANAARYGASLVAHTGAVIAAVGPATARALGRAGLAAAAVPDEFDSEGLLGEARTAGRPGQHVVLIKGRQGRELLQQELRQRGAEVVLAEVYARERSYYTPAALNAVAAQAAATGIDIITATSVEIATQVHQLVHPALTHLVAHAQWLVPSERVAAVVRGLGVATPILQAASAEDHDLVETLLSWRRRLSGA